MITPDNADDATTADLRAEIERLDTYNLDAVRARLTAFVRSEMNAMYGERLDGEIVCNLVTRLNDEANNRVAFYRRILRNREVEAA